MFRRLQQHVSAFRDFVAAASAGLAGQPGFDHLTPSLLAARIVAVTDCFDAVTSKRSYRKPEERRQALSLLQAGAGRSFDPRVVRTFVRMVGIFPVGSLVQLSGGEVAVVVRNHERLLARPHIAGHDPAVQEIALDDRPAALVGAEDRDLAEGLVGHLLQALHVLHHGNVGGDRAQLSPIRFYTEQPYDTLPNRLGLLNAPLKDKQELVLYVLDQEKRFQTANYTNVQPPTNVEVEFDVKERIGEFYNLIGNIYVLMQQPETAIRAFEYGISLAPQEAQLYYNVAISYSGAKREAEAIASLKTAISLQPAYASAHYGLAAGFLTQGYPVPALLAAVLLVGALGGLRFNLWGYAFRPLARRFLGPPAYLEPESPPRFANLLGGLMLAGAAAALALGAVWLGQVLAGVVAGLALLNAAANFCVGCKLYGLLVRPRHRTAPA